ncbi:unnamed protein product [Trichobilharzia regenti]|nr:unnamed protein product [Trichobilharzia regenti]
MTKDVRAFCWKAKRKVPTLTPNKNNYLCCHYDRYGYLLYTSFLVFSRSVNLDLTRYANSFDSPEFFKLYHGKLV